MVWLSGWSKRIKITVDSADIDSALSDFPTLVRLSTSSGWNNVDVSCVFDELESNDNRKKIAITTSDGMTQCYVEIEKWDHANKKAWLWVKIPNVASDADTELWIYYDKTKADNTAYVGDPSDDVVHNVWDDNHKLVTHMRDDPDASHIRDSTVNANDGTKKAAGEPAVTIDGKMGDAQSFDGEDDYVEVTHHSSIDLSILTLEAWVKPTNAISDEVNDLIIIVKGSGTDLVYAFQFDADNTDKLQFVIYDGISWRPVIGTKTDWVAGTWYHVVVTFEKPNVVFYVDGSVDNSPTLDYDITPSSTPLRIGHGVPPDTKPFDGIGDETRISNMVRIPAWIKASYESGRDHLLDFGSEEEEGVVGQPFALRRRNRYLGGFIR